MPADLDLTAHSPLPVACTLGPEDGRSRLLRWHSLHEAAAGVAHVDAGRLEVRYQSGPGVLAELVELATAEQTCCSFATWSVAEVDGHPVLHVVSRTDTPGAVTSIAALFGAMPITQQPADRRTPSVPTAGPVAAGPSGL